MIYVKIFILLTSVCVLLTGCGAVNKMPSDDVESSQIVNPSTPCVVRDSDHSMVTSDGLISESFEYYFIDKNTVAVDVTVTNNGEREVSFNCTPRIWAETDLTPEDFSYAWTQQYIYTDIEPGESTVLTANYSLLEDGWSSTDLHIKLFCDFDNNRYDPYEMQYDFTISYDNVDWKD